MSSAAWIGWVLLSLLLAYNTDRARRLGDGQGAALWGVLTGAAFAVMLFITAIWARA